MKPRQSSRRSTPPEASKRVSSLHRRNAWFSHAVKRKHTTELVRHVNIFQTILLFSLRFNVHATAASRMTCRIGTTTLAPPRTTCSACARETRVALHPPHHRHPSRHRHRHRPRPPPCAPPRPSPSGRRYSPRPFVPRTCATAPIDASTPRGARRGWEALRFLPHLRPRSQRRCRRLVSRTGGRRRTAGGRRRHNASRTGCRS